MKKNILSAMLLCSLLTLSSCVKEPWEYAAREEIKEGEGCLKLGVGTAAFDYKATKSTLGYAEESRVYNMMVFMFNSEGSKVYGKLFDAGNLKNSESELVPDTWYVDNTGSGASNSVGGLMLKGPSGAGHSLYILTNLDADMVKTSSDYLQHNINNIDELMDFEVEMNQETVYRNGYFPMCASLQNVSIPSGGKINYITNPVELRRLDAKVSFVFKSGQTAASQRVESFEPEQWKVVNVPKSSYLIERDGLDSHSVPADAQVADYQEYAKYFFDTEWINFEDFPDDLTSGFSFYMLENRMRPKRNFNAFEQRSRQMKDGGLNRKYALGDKEILLFENANDFSTYVLVTGKLRMALENDDAGQILGADVQYMIHLGDWSEPDNYETKRNTEYRYTITINSVNNIRVEVETSKAGSLPVENQPGATGELTIAKEEIAVCDAHFVSKTLKFHARNLIKAIPLGNGRYHYEDLSQDLSWRVSTPFSTGRPQIVNGADVPTGLDYKWVHFRLNKEPDLRRAFCSPDRVFEMSPTYRTADDNADADGTEGLAGYHNDGLMDIIYLVKFIKQQTETYCAYLNGGGSNTSLFNNPDRLLNGDGTINEGEDAPMISLTVFVDEYYYDKEPLSGSTSPVLWKRFVNQKDRTMQILCSSDTSADLESTATGSVVSIQQRSIQCIYNTDPALGSLTTAWGIENEDENEYAKRNGAYWSYSGGTIANSTRNSGNTSDFNGRWNSVKEFDLWNLVEGRFREGQEWRDYMSFEKDNDIPQLNEEHQYLRYSCMSRNRDNNGNGIIEEEEIVWYTAADKQLLGIYMGDGVLNARTRLYNRSETEAASDWMQHVVSSTQFPSERKSDSPTVFWAEEGVSTSSLYNDKEIWKTSDRWTVRCVRNLGIPAGKSASEYGADNAPDKIPQDYIVHNPEDKFFFDISYLNPACQRFYSSRELDFHFENSTENRVYKAFRAYPEDTPLGGNFRLNGIMNADKSLKVACPEGYRFPNQRELAIMRDYLGVKANGGLIENSISRTATSIGYYSAHPKPGKENAYGFSLIASGAITIGADASYVRCVKDIRE